MMASEVASVQVVGLHAEYASTPQLGLPCVRPRLSWRMESARAGARQTAWRIQAAAEVAALAEGRAELWDSGWQAGAASAFLPWGGPDLVARQAVYWQVRIRDELGIERVSAPSQFEIGLQERSDWQAQWIGAGWVGGPYQSAPCPHLRRRFVLERLPRRARLHLTALGCHRASLNGQRIGAEELSPGWTDFRIRVRVSSHDVGALLRPGANVLGVVLGDGWYCGHLEKRQRQLYGERPLLLAQLELEHGDGRRELIVSDPGWEVAAGAILASDLIMGEEYDARRHLPDWDAPGGQGGSWSAAQVFAPQPEPALVGWLGPPIRAQEVLAPVADPRRHGRGAWIIDLGQNLVGRIRLRLREAAGTTVTLRYAERLEADGSLHVANLRTARATDHYTCAGGEADEVWEASFTVHGFQFVEISGLTQPPTRNTVTGIVLHSGWPLAAGLQTSHAQLDRLFQNIVWGWKGNSLDVPTDCPQRDERLGWTGDAQAFAATAACLGEVGGFFAEWLQSLRDEQGPDGSVAALVPHSHLPGTWPDGGPGWADAMVICPWEVYLRTGDRELLRAHWPALRRWLAQQEATCREGLRAGPGSGTPCYGDWLALDGSPGTVGGTPHELIGAAFYALALDLGRRIASALDETAQATALAERHAAQVAAFQHHFLTPAGRLVAQTQTAAVLALHAELVPPALRDTVADALEADIRRRGDLLATGFLGTPWLLPVLTRAGRHATAAALLLQTRVPSWLYAVTQGATTIWERWDGWTPERGFHDPRMNSFNHYAFGAIGAWLLESLAGIAPDPERPGMQELLLAPQPAAGLERVAAWRQTPYGRVESAWRREHGGLHWDVVLPANAQARVRLPEAARLRWSLDGRELATAELELAAGRHAFVGCPGEAG